MCSNLTSPDAVLTSSEPYSPRASRSAEAVETSTSVPGGAVTWRRTSTRPRRKKLRPKRSSTVTTTSWPSPRGRSSMRASSSISGSESSSTTVCPPSTVSRSMRPAGILRLSRTGPGVSKVSRLIASSPPAAAARAGGLREPRRAPMEVERTSSCDSPPSSALGEAPEPLAGSLGGPADPSRKGADEPAVDGDALAPCRQLDRRLQRLGQAERDPGRQAVVGRRLGRSFLLADVDERRVLACEAHLDMPGRQLRVELERRLAECVEEAEPGRAANRLQHALGCLSRLLVADGRDRGQVGLERLDEPCHLHDVIMTSLR